SDAVRLFVLPLSSGWPWVLLSAGIVGPLAMVGLLSWGRRGGIFERVCLALVAAGLAFLALCHFPDAELKAAVFLRFWAVPRAATGVTVMLEVTTGWRRWFLLSLGFVAFTQAALVGVAGAGHFLKTAYSLREASETALITHLRGLPRSAWILMPDPNQELAA